MALVNALVNALVDHLAGGRLLRIPNINFEQPEHIRQPGWQNEQ